MCEKGVDIEHWSTKRQPIVTAINILQFIMEARFSLYFEVLAFLLLYFAHCACNAPVIPRDTSYGGIPVRILREDSNQLLSVTKEGNVFGNGSTSERSTCFLYIPLNTIGRIELESSMYKGVFIGLSAERKIVAAPKSELLYSTFEITRSLKTPLKIVVPEHECALTVDDDDDRVTLNACLFNDWSGSGMDTNRSGSGVDTNAVHSTDFDLFTFLQEYACL